MPLHVRTAHPFASSVKLGGKSEGVHHTQLLKRLVLEKKLVPVDHTNRTEETLTTGRERIAIGCPSGRSCFPPS